MEDSEDLVRNHGEEDDEVETKPDVEASRQITASLKPPACQVCQDLMQMFASSKESPPATTKIILGSDEGAIPTDCPRHGPLAKWFVDLCWPEPCPPESSYVFERKKSDLGVIFQHGNVELFDQPLERYGAMFHLALANKSPFIPDHVRKARIIDPMYIDLDILKYWKNECLRSHGTRCQNAMKIFPTRPAWLVDVKQMCVVPGDDVGSSFVALSYRQGSQPGISVVPELMRDLQRPGILNKDEDDPDEGEADKDEASSWVSRVLTPMIRHAIYLTSKLDERYLWVDALCIVHDDGTTADQLGLMGAIYASATVVIIATDGDAQDGIAGLRGVAQSCPREFEQHSFPFGDEEIIVVRDSHSLDNFHGAYYRRGWTYQEHRMASRKIFIQDGLAHWECQCSQWHEDLAPLAQMNVQIEPRLRDALAGFPELSSLSNIIMKYNLLDLRYQEDALPGITGLLSALSRSFTGGFLYGIPEAFFDRAVGWMPYLSAKVSRRVASNRPSHLKFAAGLPSWSWVGWQGLITIGEEADRINHRVSHITETVPVTQWYTGDSPTTPPQARRRIRSTWYEQRSALKKSAADLTVPLPDGWTRLEVKHGEKSEFDEPLLWPEGCGGYVYKHERLPESYIGPTDTFFYPFPVPKITESTPPNMPKQTAYLFCTTQRVRLWTRGEIVPDIKQAGRDILRIYVHNESGISVGSLLLHTRDQLEWLEAMSAGTESGVQVELVAVNRVLSWGNTWNEQEQKHDFPQWTRDKVGKGGRVSQSGGPDR
ncbi:unnamed protein product [Clonostachys rosea]|uniref:Heterokaryon incompatibility domain-containing protein n=1 Tax=Bionectria ochroleuca TaxID=29856 RepID=A0ABY6U6G1_BIOOC|nr:unnamed protein product [Clonostachys rosea]